MLLLGFAAHLVGDSCMDLGASIESAHERKIEAEDIIRRSSALYRQQKTAFAFSHLPDPLSASVYGKTATLKVASRIDATNLYYAQAWYEVYNLHHRASSCVILRVEWQGGGIVQHFPISL